MTAALPTPGRPALPWCRWRSRRNGQDGPSAPSRPASTFVAQLLATAEHAPQTRTLRRGTAADAQTAYSAHRQQARVAASGPGTSDLEPAGVSAACPGTGCEPSPGCKPRGRHLRRGRRRRDLGMRDFRLRAIQRHGFGCGCGAEAGRRGHRFELGFGLRRLGIPRIPPRDAAPAIAPRRLRSAMPDRKSTSDSSVSRKKVEVPNCGSNTNSAPAPQNTSSESRWSVRYFAPGRAPLMTSHSNIRMPSVSRPSVSVTGQPVSEGSGTVKAARRTTRRASGRR